MPTIKVPVVLTEPTVQIDVDYTFTLPAPAIDIKRIGKHLKLTQLLVLNPANKLSIKGFVRKNIEFSIPVVVTPTSITGPIQQFTTDIPFSAVVPLSFNLAALTPLGENSVSNFEFLSQTVLPSGFPAKDYLASGDLSEFNQVSTEFFNELPFVELVSSTIIEYDEYINRAPVPGGPFEEQEFTVVEEKMVIYLTLKVLQNQQVFIL
jgi:hypothetical protein